MSAVTGQPGEIGRLDLWQESRGLYLVPLRHHSPACAGHLKALIEEVAPALVLVEGPCDFDPLIPLVTAEATRPPVAIVAFPERKPGRADEVSVVSYFPFCAHSPEYVALSEAAELGSEARFIDLPSSHRIALGRGEAEADGEAALAISLTDERAFDASDYGRALCRRIGCRDQNELWDHLFESRAGGRDWRRFFRDVGVYCAHVRAATPAAQIEREGHPEREAQMVALLREALDDGKGPIVAVTGGFHTPALIEGLAAEPPSRKPKRGAGGAEAYLIRYGFRQLDQLNDYAAGLPLPGFYDRLWQRAANGEAGEPLWRDLAVEVVTGFAAHLRRTQPSLSPPLPVLTAALEAASRLAALRGRPGPTREDLLDACRSTLLKGEQAGDLTPVMGLLHGFLTGSAIGDIPPSAGSPPLVEAARAQARRLGFNLEDGEARNRKLDIYRKPRHREVSRFLHALAFLEAGFAARTSGPDFLSGVKLDVLSETWSYAWSPMVEARLIELAAGAETVAEACLRVLRKQLRALGEQGRGRNAGAVVQLFLSACQAGVADRAEEILPLIEAEVTSDPELRSVVAALGELHLLWRGREVLGMTGADTVERLIGVAYARALYLLPDLTAAREEDLSSLLEALASLREIVTTAGAETEAIDETLFDEAVAALLASEVHPAIAGALACLAFLAELIGGGDLVARLRGNLGGAVLETGERIAFLRGLIAISRELLWRLPALAEAADEILGGLDEDSFVSMLPNLRLAFAALDPREADRFAQRIAARHQVAQTEVTGAVRYDASAEEVQRNLELSRRLLRCLEEDGLRSFVEAEVRS